MKKILGGAVAAMATIFVQPAFLSVTAWAEPVRGVQLVQAQPGLQLKVRKILGASALIEYRGSTGIFSKDDERLGVFKVVEISSDHIVVFSIPEQKEKSFSLESAEKPPIDSSPALPTSVSDPISPPSGKGGFKIIGIIGIKGNSSVIMEKGGVQLTLKKGQTVEGKFTVVDIKEDGVVLSIPSENITGTFSAGDIFLAEEKTK